MAVTSDPTQIAAAIKKVAFAQQLAQAVSKLRNQGGSTPVGNNNGGGGGSSGGGGGVVASTLAGLPQSPMLEELKAKGLIKEGMAPEQALAILNLAGIRGGVPLDIKALTDQVKLDYENLTGDITGAGADWMKELYGNVTPGAEDPNAALFAQDPIFSSYAGGLAQIDETADINEASDLAWFQKQQEAEQSFIDNLMQYTASGGLTPTGGGGGGGGGGRGGGYGGGGGGGGGDGDLGYGDIKTTERLRELFRLATSNEMDAQNPNFATNLMQWAGQEIPEDAEALQSLLYQNQTPETLLAALPDEIAARQAGFMGGVVTNASNAQWTGTQPEAVDERMRQFMAQNNITLGDDPSTQGVVEPYYYSENLIGQTNAGAPIENPLYGTDVDFSYGMPQAGPNSVGQQTPGQLDAWQRNADLFQQLLDPANMTQNRDPNGLQGEELRNSVAGIAGGIRDLARKQAAGGSGFNARAHMAAANPWSNIPSYMRSPTTSTSTPAANPSFFPQATTPTGIHYQDANDVINDPTFPQNPQGIEQWLLERSDNMTEEAARGVYSYLQAEPTFAQYLPPEDQFMAGSSVTGPPSAPIGPNTSTGGMFPNSVAAVQNVNSIISNNGDIDFFLQNIYPGLPPDQRNAVDNSLNGKGIDTPGRTAGQFKVMQLLENARAGQNNRGSGVWGGGYTPMDPTARSRLMAPQNVTDLVNRAWQGMGLGGNLNMEQRPDIAGLLQEQSVPIWESSYLDRGVDTPETPPQGAVWNPGAPTPEALNAMLRTAASLTAAQDVVESMNQNFNYVNTHASGASSTMADEQLTSQGYSWEPEAAIQGFGVGDFNESAPDPLPGSILDTNVADTMPDFTGGNQGYRLPQSTNDNSFINRLINGINLQTPAPAATTGIGSAGRPQPTSGQRQQVSNLASSFKQAALKQQAADKLTKVRSLLSGVKKNFG